MIKYFPESSLLTDPLENFSLCEKHYNQIIATNNFYKNLVNSDPLTQKNHQDEIADDEPDPLAQLQRMREKLAVSESNFEDHSRIDFYLWYWIIIRSIRRQKIICVEGF